MKLAFCHHLIFQNPSYQGKLVYSSSRLFNSLLFPEDFHLLVLLGTPSAFGSEADDLESLGGCFP